MARTTKSSVSLAGKIVAITGGARGIGRATAEEFLAKGAVVALGDIDVELAEKTAAELAAVPGARVAGLRLNVADRASFAAFLDAVEAQFGGIDVLINNAGIMPTGLFIDEDDAMTDRQIEINLRGVITGSKLAAKRFVPRGSGTIVNIASLAGVIGEPGLATYCATKHAVVGFSEALHEELRASGVTVSAVLPGIVRTELSAGAQVPGWLESTTTVDPADVARTIVKAVLSDRARLTVPKSLSATLKILSLLPERAKRAIGKATKLDVAFSQADPAVREAYHRRIAGGAQ